MEENNLISHNDAQHSWDRARRGVLIQKVLCALKNCSVDLIPFEEVRTRLHLTQKLCRGVQNIDIDRIRGSVGRYQDFTSAFLPRKKHLRQRWQRVRAYTVGQSIPPIEVFQVGEAYFISDGNHRVSIARHEGWKTIEAYVCEFVTPVDLSPEADLNEVIIKAEYTEFLNTTNLNKLRPDHEIRFTNPGRYQDLEMLITAYQDQSAETNAEETTFEEALVSWFDQVYDPTIQEIQSSGLLNLFPDRTEADLFIWLWKHQGKLEKND